MKKVLVIIAAITLLTTQTAYAVKSTPTPTEKATTQDDSASDSADMSTIEKIKEMVASKISKMNLIEKKGILGTVKEVTNTQITIETTKKTQQFIDIDELTKFEDSMGSSKTFGISDVKPGDQLAFIGNYNKETHRLLARFITKADTIPLNYEGVVTDKDTRNYNITIIQDNGTKKTISIESSTKTYSYDPNDGELKSGFSKIEIGKRIIVVGFQDPTDKDTISATRILFFTQLPLSPKLEKYVTETPTPTPKK